ncbi:hypothetical protein ASE02_11500 [Phenylobacterium sp. Root700]|nr:hypothetical protein ASE02_11500 [Phenylobacterium sp. Root700]
MQSFSEDRAQARMYAFQRECRRTVRKGVDLRERPALVATAFQLEAVAVRRPQVEIGLHQPAKDVAAPWTLDGGEFDQVAFDREACLLLELTSGGGQGRFARFDPPLGKRPSLLVLATPKRAARMDEQEFKASAAASEDQKPGAVG